MKTKIKDRPVTIRLPEMLYQTYINKALTQGQKEKRIVKISEVIRETLEKNKYSFIY